MSSAQMSSDEFWLYVARVVGIAVIHVGAFLACAALTYGSKGSEVPLIGLILVHVLGFPLMYILYIGPDNFGSLQQNWGAEAVIVGLAILNALLWGAVAMWAVARWKRQRSQGA